MNTYLAIDPGTATGVCYLSGPRAFGTDVGGGLYGIIDYLRDFQRTPDYIIMESFTISQRTMKATRVSDPIDIIGWVKGKCYELDIPLDLQTPAQAKKFSTDDKLIKADLWFPSQGGHANDAARHLLAWLYKHEPAIFQQRMAGQ